MDTHDARQRGRSLLSAIITMIALIATAVLALFCALIAIIGFTDKGEAHSTSMGITFSVLTLVFAGLTFWCYRYRKAQKQKTKPAALQEHVPANTLGEAPGSDETSATADQNTEISNSLEDISVPIQPQVIEQSSTPNIAFDEQTQQSTTETQQATHPGSESSSTSAKATPVVKAAYPEDLTRVPTGWFMPVCDGEQIWSISDRSRDLAKTGDVEGALAESNRALDAMITAMATINPACAMDHYVIEVAKLQTKLGRTEEVVATIDRWLDLNPPAHRPDHRSNIQKRRARAAGQLAKLRGEDPTRFTEEWRSHAEAEKTAIETMKIARKTGTNYIASGATEMGHNSYLRSKQKSKNNDTFLDEPVYYTIDFETANQNHASACQVSIVEFVNGKPARSTTSLIQPPAELSEFEFTYLHGIKPKHVKKAPTWDAICQEVADLIGDKPVYAHNAKFDHDVWKSLDEWYGTSTAPHEMHCTVKLARKYFPGLSDYKLPTVIKRCAPHFKHKHHDATSDAKACGLIVAAIIEARKAKA